MVVVILSVRVAVTEENWRGMVDICTLRSACRARRRENSLTEGFEDDTSTLLLLVLWYSYSLFHVVMAG